MSPLRALRAASSRSGLPIASIPAGLILYVLVVDAVVGAWAVAAFVRPDVTVRSLGVLVLLAALAVVFEEGAARIARLQWRMSSQLKRDMTSVWAVAAAVALPPWAGVSLLLCVFAHIWFRQQRHTGQPLYRTWFTMSTGMLGCLAAGAVVREVSAATADLPWALSSSVAVLVAIVVHTVLNRALISGALIGVGARGRDLIGTRDENLSELSTLCLGGLVAVAALHEPWLCLLVVPPLVALQRGAFVRELEAAAITDAKTGLLNAVAWEQLAQRELVRAEREQTSLAVLIVDIDRFKTVNDRFGHLVGDQVLRGIGRSLTDSLREYDSLGRFGGEEFVAVLPDSGEHDALVVAERLRSRVNQLSAAALAGAQLGAGGDDLLSVSVGVAVLRLDGGELSDLLRAADAALYVAKANGRNQVRLAERGGDLPERVTR